MDNQTEKIKTLQGWWDIDKHHTSLEGDLKVEIYKDSVSVNLYTEYNRYRIVARNNYLGCTMTCRRSYVGENWTRGRDFPDGKFTYETWSDIIRAIAMHEIVGMAGKVKDVADTCEVTEETKS